jgi:hypothetical protein
VKKNEYLTVSEYAQKEGISVQGVYKRINSRKVETKKQYGLILIKVK